MRTRAWTVILWLLAAPAAAQSGLEGTTVVVKMDMPATSDGVDVRPQRGGVDFHSLNDRLRRYGVGVHTGEAIMITKVVYKSDHIEVQLGGGGFGTFADQLAVAAATPVVPYEGKSRREKDLEDEAKYADGYRERRDARRALDDERRDRSRANSEAVAINAENRAVAQQQTDMKRAGAGSRFNIRYDGSIPPSAATPQGIMDALASVVDFSEAGPPPPSDPPPPGSPPSGSPSSGPPSSSGPEPAAAQLSALRKGMTVPQVEQTLGPADSVRRETDGSMEVTVREYVADDGQRVSTKFVGGVLVEYTIASKR